MAASSVRATPAFRTDRQSLVPDTPGTRRMTAGSTQGRGATNQLPDYEPPTFSLTPTAQRAIAGLSRNPTLKKLEKHIEEAQTVIKYGAADINDRLTQGRNVVNKRKRGDVEPSSQDGEEAGEAGDDVARVLVELQDKVTRMTQRMEESMRKMIDGQHGVEHIKNSLAATVDDARVNASTQASTQHIRSQRRTRRGSRSGSEDEEEDDDELQPFTPTDPTGGTQLQTAPVEIFKKKLEDAKTRYQSSSRSARYAENTDYINFKQLIHDAQHPDEDVPMPHIRTWFQEHEPPAPGVTARGGAAGTQEDDSDDDLAMTRATISIKCPLTLQEFKDPLSSRKCNHSFEAAAILEMLRTSPTRGSVQCPCGGCRETLTKNDLQRDPVLLRKIKRIQRAKELEEEEAEDGDGDGRTQRNATVIEDDGEEVDTIIERQTQRQMKDEPRGTAVGRPSGTAPVELWSSDEEEDEEDEEEVDETME